MALVVWALPQFLDSCVNLVCREGGCNPRNCEFEKLDVRYTEVNDWLFAIPGDVNGGFSNALFYDGELMQTHRQSAMDAGESRLASQYVQWYNTSNATVRSPLRLHAIARLFGCTDEGGRLSFSESTDCITLLVKHV